MNLAHVNTTFCKPAEFAPHARSWMIWPHRDDLYGGRLPDVQREFIAVVQAIAQFEPVTVVAHPDHAGRAQKKLTDCATVIALPVDDFWMRDCGPSFLTGSDGSLAGVSWQFNAWGEKHAPWAVWGVYGDAIRDMSRGLASARQATSRPVSKRNPIPGVGFC